MRITVVDGSKVCANQKVNYSAQVGIFSYTRLLLCICRGHLLREGRGSSSKVRRSDPWKTRQTFAVVLKFPREIVFVGARYKHVRIQEKS